MEGPDEGGGVVGDADEVESHQGGRGEVEGGVLVGEAELVEVGLAGVGVFVAPVVDGGGDGGVGGDDL